MKTRFHFSLLLLLTSLLLLSSLHAQGLNASNQPDILKKIGIDQRLGEQAPLDLEFYDEAGNTVPLQQYFGEKPVILALVYYNCPMLCNLVLNGLTKNLKPLSFSAGEEFDIISLSFDHRETPALAAEKKKNYLKDYDRASAASGWHFLTGDSVNISRLAEAVGFRYQFDPVTQEYAHAGGIMVLTPQGKLARYFYGVDYPSRDLRLSLVEASENKIGSPVDQLLLYCYHYDPRTGKYGLVIMNVLRLAGIATVLVLVAFVIVMLRRDRKMAVSARA
ncbi:SCO family protein [candidate division KSB1 bacterium]|nr:MAG: SCO family protein [candidate division KSB1 bacterium]MBC6947013.1 SCO family protein [candidate division KSB1 bacterium]MCE7942750.1 SCO family protein [Chlorobi bacterium CHB1]MDL1878296.1 SCO family protein [Cytophagia bacterium CHB2]